MRMRPTTMAPILIFLLQFPAEASKHEDESTMMRESVWVDDRNITECQHCKKPFSVARRKVGVDV